MPLQFIDKRPRGGVVVATPGTPTVTPTIVDGLHGGDVVISISGLTMFIIQSGIVVVHAALEKIANWSVEGTRLIVHSLDETSLNLLTFELQT